MSNYLVKFQRDWGDEFYATGFRIFRDMTPYQITEKLAPYIQSGFYFGTNEGWEEDELSIDDFEFIEISDDQANVLNKFFSHRFGQFPPYV